jgi:hypothetical protein
LLFPFPQTFGILHHQFQFPCRHLCSALALSHWLHWAQFSNSNCVFLGLPVKLPNESFFHLLRSFQWRIFSVLFEVFRSKFLIHIVYQ